MEKEVPYQWILWEDTPLKETSNSLSEIGISSIVFNPTGNKPETGDYLSIMRLNIENVKNAYK